MNADRLLPALFIRAALAGAVLGFAYAAAYLGAYFWPLIAIVVGVAAWRNAGRWKGTGWNFGSARIATEDDCASAGMTDDGDGLILARSIGGGRPSLLKASAGLFTASLAESEQACLRMLASLFARWRQGGQLLRAPLDCNHGLICAPPGSGKGTGFLIPNLRTYRGAVVALDPKGELFSKSARQRQAMGHRLVRLDFFQLLGRDGDGINPLDWIDDSSLSAADDALALASALIVREANEGESKHFNDVATTILQSLILFVCCHADPSERDLVTVNQLLKSTEAFIGAVKTMRESTACAGALSQIAGVIGYLQDREFASVMSTTCRALAFMDSPLVAAGFLKTTFDPMGLLRGDTDIFIAIPAQLAKSHAAVSRAILTTLIRFVVTHNGASERNKVVFLLDEIASAGHVPEIESGLQMLRGYGCRLWLIIQHLGQLQTLFPADKGAGVLSSTDVQMFFGLNDVQSAEYCSSRIGDCTITTNNVQRGGGTSRNHTWGVSMGQSSGTSTNDGVTLAEAGRRLIKSEEILLMRGLALIYVKGQVPIVGQLIRYYQDSDFQGECRPARRLGAAEALTAVGLLLAALWLAAVATPAKKPRGHHMSPQWQQQLVPGPFGPHP